MISLTTTDIDYYFDEDVVMKMCFVDELLVLNEGIIIESNKFGLIFVQVRLVYNINYQKIVGTKNECFLLR
jgi:hypothetical protein